MGLTIIGSVVLGAGLLLLFMASMRAMLGYMMITTLFSGSAAIALGASGSASSIPPADLALVFVVLRAILPGAGQMQRLQAAIRANAFLIVFSLYGAGTAWILPTIFRGAAEVTPLHPGAIKALFEAAPIRFSSQNITTAIYLLGTLTAGIGGYLGAARPGGAATIVTFAIFVAITHAALGFLSILVGGTPFDAVIEFFRNGNYAQLDQSLGGFTRMAGICPEASAFAAYAGSWLIFMTELWLRDVRARWTGGAALLLAFALIIATSSTGYVTLLGYALLFVLRALLIPWSLPPRKALALAAALLTLAIVALSVAALAPAVLDHLSRIISLMTVEKEQSASGRQRAFWAWQGLHAFVISGGLGIGAGTFRSSSLIAAILGSTGVIGMASFAGHLLRAFKPLNASTYYGVAGDGAAVGAAASWTALLMLMPAAVASPSSDPGLVWGLFCGIALGLRRETLVTPSRIAPRFAAVAAVPAR